MRFKLGGCCCPTGNPCLGDNVCHNNQITQIPNDIYVIISGTAYDQTFTSGQLVAGGVLPDTTIYTGWVIDYTIQYEPNILNWLFNKKWKLRNQTSWGYQRLGSGILEFPPGDSGDPFGCFWFGNPYSGGRLDCLYEYSQIHRIKESIYYTGWYGSGWTWKYFGDNIVGFPLVDYAPQPACPATGSTTYISYLNQDHYTCPHSGVCAFDGTSGPNTFICGTISDYPNDCSITDLSNESNFGSTRGYITYYIEENITPVNISENISISNDNGSSATITVINCNNFGLVYPKIDFGWIDKCSVSPGVLRLQSIGHTLAYGEVDPGTDGIKIGKSASYGIETQTTNVLANKTYHAGATGPRTSINLDFGINVPISYTELLNTNFLPFTGGSLLGQVKATLACANSTYVISINDTGSIAIAIQFYDKVTNGSNSDRKTASYKIMSCGIQDISLKFTCDSNGAMKAII